MTIDGAMLIILNLVLFIQPDLFYLANINYIL